MSFRSEFRSWYWEHMFAEPALQTAVETIDGATDPEEFRRAFLVLLRSGDTVAQGIAMHVFDVMETSGRHGGDHGFEPFRGEVVAVARRMLRRPPQRDDILPFQGADHASALLALKHAGGPEDAEAVLAVLRRRPTGELLYNALVAAEAVVAGCRTPPAALVDLLGELAFDRSLDVQVRHQALTALGEAAGEAAIALLVRATGAADRRLQQQAACGLSYGRGFYGHRDLLARLAASWPQEAGGVARDVVAEALAAGPHSRFWEGVDLPGPRLRRAHREMRSPTSERAHRGAFRTLLYSGLVPAVGIALDHYGHPEGLGRFGLDIEPFTPHVRALARHLLTLAPSSARASPRTGAGASHATALDVLAGLAEPGDGRLLATTLRQREAAPLVVKCAIAAAAECLGRWGTPHDLVITALEELILAPSTVIEDRIRAVDALFLTPGDRVTAILLHVAHSGVLPGRPAGAPGATRDDLIDWHRDLTPGPAWRRG